MIGTLANAGMIVAGGCAGLLIKKGEAPRKVTGDLAEILVSEIKAMLG